MRFTTANGSTIDATHGQKGETYTLAAWCANCGWYGSVRRLKGVSVIGSKFLCPNCGCRDARASKSGDWGLP